MALNFDISFEQALRQLADTKARLAEVGQLLDKNEKDSAKLGSAMAQALRNTNTYFSRVESPLQKTGAHTAELSNQLEMARKAASKAFNEMANSNTTATIRLKALNGELGQLDRLVKDTASKKTYTNWLQRTATLNAEAAGQTQFYQAKLAQLNTEEGRAAVNAARLVRERTKAIQALGRGASVADNYRAIVNQLINSEREMAVTGQRVAWGYERMSVVSAELTAQQRAAKLAIDQANTSMVEGAANIERYTGANAAAVQAVRNLQQAETRAAAGRKRELAELRAAIEQRAKAEETATARQVAAADQQARALRVSRDAVRLLGEAEARTNAERARQVRGAQAYNEGMLRNAASTRSAADATGIYAEQLRRATAVTGSGGAERLNRIYTNLAASGREATSSLRALTSQEAQLQVQEARLATALRARNQLTLEQARASTTLSSAEARLTQQIRAQTAEYQRRAALMQMTTAQLLGLTGSHDRNTRALNVNAQAAAMFRAGLGGLHASIGIYTSATVLAASATYALASAFRTGLSAGMEFTETMARAEAVMMTGSEAATAAGRSMEAVNMQVRALGASTLFTSTEVAGGLVDLGMAGLSASESMTALSPALNLAAIGSIEMSRAADIATNVMTSFDKTANELGNVVDIMATAITNSNTNIEQLANALSYVGPAAQAAGFELRDTTAAIELLSNSGIKASRAGTGLRRFMLNIQNPTAKGAAVMDQFGISVVNAEGQTRSMTDILGQFHTALHNDAITPAQRTAAIMDLVGVRAQSAVARMIGSFEQFGVLRRQLEEVDGAAEKMRETMEDVLSMDWRQLKSAFQDVQLDVFTTYEQTLRSFTAQARLSLMELQSVNEEMTNLVFSPEQIADGEVVTELDVLIAKVGEAIDVVKGLGIAFGTWKAAGIATTMTSALSTNLWSFGERMETVNHRVRVYERYQKMANVQTLAAGNALGVKQKVALLATQGVNALTRETYLYSQALAVVGRAAAVFTAALGWAGVVYGVYTAVSTLFSNDTESRISSHNDRVRASVGRYQELKEQIEKTTEARQVLALNTRARDADTEAEGLRESIRLTEIALGQMGDESTGRQRATDDWYRYSQALATAEAQATEAREAIDQVGTNQAQVEGMRAILARLALNIGRATEKAEEYQEKAKRFGDLAAVTRAVDGGEALTKAHHESASAAEFLTGVIATLVERYHELAGATNAAELAASNHAEYMSTALNAQTLQITAEYEFEQLSDFEKMNKLASDRNVILASYIQLSEHGVALSTEGTDKMLRSLDVALELNEGYLKAQQSVNETWTTVSEAHEKLEAAQRNEIDTLESLEKQMNAVQSARVAMLAMDSSDPEKVLELYKEQISLQERHNTLTDRANRPGRKTGISEAEKEMNKAIAAFERLRAEYDPLGTASREFNDTQKQLQSLLAANKISTEDYGLAINHLAKDLQESVEEHSEYYKKLKHLRETYLKDTSLTTLFTDKASLSTLPKDERLVAERVIETQIKEETFSGLPGASGLDASVSGPMGEWSRLQSETFEMEKAYDDRIAAFEDYAKRDLENKEHWAAQVSALEAKKNQNSMMMQKQSQIAMTAMGEQVLGEMADMFQQGSAIQKVMFAAQKVASIAQIIMHGQTAAWQARATIPYPEGEAVAKRLEIMSGFSAGLVGAQALGSIATGQTGGTNYAGAYDNGGYIPRGKIGIVGEVGPEIVGGPARVTSRKDTAKLLGGSGGNTYAPVFHFDVDVDMTGGDSQKAKEDIGAEFRVMAQVIEGKVIQVIQRELRPRGLLDRGKA